MLRDQGALQALEGLRRTAAAVRFPLHRGHIIRGAPAADTVALRRALTTLLRRVVLEPGDSTRDKVTGEDVRKPWAGGAE